MKQFTSLMLLASFAATNAQVAEVSGVPQRIKPTAYAAVDAQGNVISPWYPFEDRETAQVQNWQFQYDCMPFTTADPATSNFDFAKYNASTWINFLTYRQGTGLPYVNWPLNANDVQFYPGTKGFPTQYFSTIARWNPNGQALETGGNTTGLSPTVTVFTTSGTQTDGLFAPATRILGGISFAFAGAGNTPLNNGLWWFDMFLPELSQLSWPAGDGYWIQINARDQATGTIVPMPAGGTAQIAQRPQNGPDDPAFPGTNPSNSDANIWVDFDGDLALSFGDPDPLNNEVDNFDVLPPAGLPGRRQPAMFMGYDAAAPYANITVDRDCQGDEDTWVSFKWIAVDGSDVPVMDGTNFITSVVEAEPTAAGAINLIHPFLDDSALVVQNRYMLYIKPKGYLAVLTSGFNMTTGSSLGTIVFKAGDIDDDNEVGGNDLSILSGAFLSVAGDENFVADADIDGDGEVGSSDLSCLSANFLESGDADPTA